MKRKLILKELKKAKEKASFKNAKFVYNDESLNTKIKTEAKKYFCQNVIPSIDKAIALLESGSNARTRIARILIPAFKNTRIVEKKAHGENYIFECEHKNIAILDKEYTIYNIYENGSKTDTVAHIIRLYVSSWIFTPIMTAFDLIYNDIKAPKRGVLNEQYI